MLSLLSNRRKKRRRLPNYTAATCSSTISITEESYSFFGELIWVMTHSHVHLSTPVMDDQLHFRNRHMGWCGCHEILIHRSFNVLFLTNFCQLPFRSLFVGRCSSTWRIPPQNGNLLLNIDQLRAPPGSKIYFFPRALNLTEIFTEYVSDLW